jgi:hypothetical protein
MSTKNKVNASLQVKDVVGRRWICQNIPMTATTKLDEYDFIDNADGKLWKKVRPWKSSDLKDNTIAGQSRYYDDKF